MRAAPKVVAPTLAFELARLLAQARRRNWMAASRRLEPLGESIHVWQVLNHLLRLGPVTQRELAEATAQHPAGVSRTLDELEKQDLVVRHHDQNDRRKRVVELTTRGHARLKKIRPVVLAAMEESMSGLSRAEQVALHKLLLKLVE